MDINLANRIARECLAQFAKLPKTGKPNESFEWTILSAIVLVTPAHQAAASDIRVVALGTGTKCLPGDELSPRGDRVHDSHAEVLARRAFVRYLYEQIEQALLAEEGQPKESIFERQTVAGGGCGKFVLKNGHSFHFFTTHSPCGDASIYEREDDAMPPAKRARRTDETCSDRADEETTVGRCIGEDRTAVGMTGGKLLEPEAHGDLMAQTIGAVRTKPGRGVRTASVSCSDKLARWNVLGVQGGLLMMLLGRPIYLDGVVVCDGTDHSVVALERAIWGRFERWKEPAVREPFERHHRPVVIAADGGELFAYRKNRPHPTKEAGGKFQPSPCGIVWCDVKERPHEVEVAGRRHGVTKRKLATPAARLQISKIELFNRFARTYRRAQREALHNLTVPASGAGATQPHTAAADDVGKLSYADAKARSVAYASQWASVRATMFGRWPVKPTSLGGFLSDAS